MDIVVIWINREGETGLSPGAYTIDAEETVIVTFYDDADEVMIVEGIPPIVTSAAHIFSAQPGGSVIFETISHLGQIVTRAISPARGRARIETLWPRCRAGQALSPARGRARIET